MVYIKQMHINGQVHGNKVIYKDKDNRLVLDKHNKDKNYLIVILHIKEVFNVDKNMVKVYIHGVLIFHNIKDNFHMDN